MEETTKKVDKGVENAEVKGESKSEGSKTKLIIICVVAAVVIVGGVMAAILLWPKDGGRKKDNNTSEEEEEREDGGSGTKITSGKALRKAMMAKKELNCTITDIETGEKSTFAATAGFKKLKMTSRDAESGEVSNMLYLNNVFYYWDEAGEMAYKITDKDMVDDTMGRLTDPDEFDEDWDELYKVACRELKGVDFSVPKDVEFIDYDDFTSKPWDDVVYDEDEE